MMAPLQLIVNRISQLAPEGVKFALMSADGEFIHSTVSPDAREEAIRIAKSASTLMGRGDYLVKRLNGSTLVAIRMSDRFLIVLEGASREGLLVLFAQNVYREFGEELNSLNTELPSSSISVTVTKPPEEVFNPIKQLEMEFGFPPEAIPRISSRGASATVSLDHITLRILKEVDGKSTLLEIGERVGVDIREVYTRIGGMVRSGILELIPPEEDARFRLVYELSPLFVDEEEALRAASMLNQYKRLLIRILLKNIRKGYNILRYVMECRRHGLDASAEEIYALFKELERAGIVRKREVTLKE